MLLDHQHARVCDGGGIWPAPVSVSLPVRRLARRAVNAARNDEWAASACLLLGSIGVYCTAELSHK